jgi:hypothetical protein
MCGLFEWNRICAGFLIVYLYLYCRWVGISLTDLNLPLHDWSSVHASWNFIDPESPIIDYTWAIGILIITISLVITDTANNGL